VIVGGTQAWEGCVWHGRRGVRQWAGHGKRRGKCGGRDRGRGGAWPPDLTCVLLLESLCRRRFWRPELQLCEDYGEMVAGWG
jgi:hypothetical protein